MRNRVLMYKLYEEYSLPKIFKTGDKMKKIFLILAFVLAFAVTTAFSGKIFNQNALMSHLRTGLPTNLSVLTDSTGTATDEWVYILSARIASLFPNYHVEYFLWDDTDQAFNSGGVLLNDNDLYLNFEGTNGANAADGDIADITGDLDVRIEFRATDYTPSSFGALIGHYGASPQRSFYVALETSGQLKYWWTSDGTTQLSEISSEAISDNIAVVDDVTIVWIRITHDVDNGAGDSDIKFYTSSDGIAWTQLGTTQSVGATTSIANVNANWTLGARNNATTPLACRIYDVQISDGSVGLDLTAGTLGYPWLNNQNLEDLWGPRDATVTFGGGPEFRILNGSKGGASLSYWDNATRRPRAFPSASYDIVMSLVSLSHNEGATYDSTKMAEYTTLAGNLSTLEDLTTVVFVTQNPRVSPASNILPHAYRSRQLWSFVYKSGYRTIDVYRAFEKVGTWSTQGDDGVHPDETASTNIWSDTAYQWLIYEYPKRSGGVLRIGGN